eukprot:6912468-Prymnesium_polylepis.1
MTDAIGSAGSSQPQPAPRLSDEEMSTLCGYSEYDGAQQRRHSELLAAMDSTSVLSEMRDECDAQARADPHERAILVLDGVLISAGPLQLLGSEAAHAQLASLEASRTIAEAHTTAACHAYTARRVAFDRAVAEVSAELETAREELEASRWFVGHRIKSAAWAEAAVEEALAVAALACAAESIFDPKATDLVRQLDAQAITMLLTHGAEAALHAAMQHADDMAVGGMAAADAIEQVVAEVTADINEHIRRRDDGSDHGSSSDESSSRSNKAAPPPK